MRKKSFPMSTEEVHVALFDILNELDIIFKNNDIDYYLIFGTLLGCVRDGGPIKWDDDIDICVSAKNWERMNAILEESIDEKKYFVLNMNTKPNYPESRFITRVGIKGTHRVMDYYVDDDNQSGVFLDIFQLTNVPNSITTQKIWEFKMGVLDGIINMCSMKKGTYSKPYIISVLMKKIMGNKKVGDWNRLRYGVQTKYMKTNTRYITVPFGPFGVYPLKSCKYEKKWFEKSLDRGFLIKNSFNEVIREGRFSIPSGYLMILRNTYGEWWKKPIGRIAPQLSFWEEEDEH